MTKKEVLLKIIKDNDLSWMLLSGEKVNLEGFSFKLLSEKLIKSSLNNVAIDNRTPINSYQTDEYLLKVSEGSEIFELNSSYSGYIGDLQFDYLIFIK